MFCVRCDGGRDRSFHTGKEKKGRRKIMAGYRSVITDPCCGVYSGTFHLFRHAKYSHRLLYLYTRASTYVRLCYMK